MRERRFNEAEALCKKQIALNPKDYIAITQLGEVYWELNNRRKAIKLFRKSIKIEPNYPYAHFLLGRAYVFEKKHDRGIKEFDIFKEKIETLSGMDKDTVDYYVAALHYIAYMYSTMKEYDKVAEECNIIIKLKPDDQKARYNLAICYYIYYRKRHNAYNELQKIIEIDPNTHTAARARFFIDYIRNNPDPRFMEDINFIEHEE